MNIFSSSRNTTLRVPDFSTVVNDIISMILLLFESRFDLHVTVPSLPPMPLAYFFKLVYNMNAKVGCRKLVYGIRP